jgi:VanZ family protein
MIDKLNALVSSKYTAILWTVIIFFLCSYPSGHLPTINNDKTLHFIAFAGFSFFWFFHSSKPWLIILLAAFYGISIEFWQAILPNSFHRGFDWYDALADSVGGVIGYIIWLVYRRLIRYL